MRQAVDVRNKRRLTKSRANSKRALTKKAKHGFQFVMWHLPFGLCFFLIASCRLSQPQAPRWETTINLPIISRNYTMQELIDKQDNLYADGAGLVHFFSESELEAFTIGDRLAIDAFNKSFVTPFGRYTVPSPGSLSAQISLRQIYPASVDLSGQNAPLPAFGFSLPLLALPKYENFVQVESADGTLTVTVRNGLVVPLGPPLRVEIQDGINGPLIAIADFNSEIPPGGEAARVVNLAEKDFSNSFVIQLSGRSPGSRGNRVRIDPDSKSTITLALSALEVSGANAKIGPKILSGAGETGLGDSLKILAADLKRGTINLQAEGNFPVGAWMVVTLLDFYAPNNVPIQDSLLLNAHGRAAKTFNLANYSFRPQTTAFGKQKIRFRWKIRTTNSPNEMVSIASDNAISATFESSRIVFSRLHGGFNAKTISLTPQQFKINMPAGLDSLRLAEVSLQVRLRNGINFPVRPDLQVDGIPNQGPLVRMNVRGDIKAGQPSGVPVESIITLDKGNSNIRDFFNALPKSIDVRGKVTFGDTNYVGIIRDTDVVSSRLKFDAPLAFILPAQRVESDIDVLKIEKSIRDRLRDHLHRGKIHGRLINHLPLGASISLHLAQKKLDVFLRPDLAIGPFTLATPDINVTGRVIREKANNVEIALSEAQLALFQKSPLYVGVLITLPGTQGKLIRVAAEDYIGLQALAEIELEVDEGKAK